MASNPIDIRPAVALATLVTIEWGDPVQYARYARWTEDFEDFTMLPEMEVDFGEQHGGVKDTPISITMKADVDPLPKYRRQRYSPATITVEEVIPAEPTSRRTRFKGRLDTVKFSPNGRANVARLMVKGFKSLLEVPLGLKVTSNCQRVFGSADCGFDLALAQETEEATELEGQVLRVDDAAEMLERDVFYWNNGTVKFNGLEIKIVYWKTGNEFILAHPAPTDWLNEDVVFSPGCDRTIFACRYHNREHRFNGFGVLMPNRHVQMEE